MREDLIKTFWGVVALIVVSFFLTFAAGGFKGGPAAVADSYSTDEDTAVVTGDVLANDTASDDSDTLTVASLDLKGTAGTVVDNRDGTFGYAPEGAFEFLGAGDSVTDTFRYRLSDGDGGFASAKVEITVSGVNDAPVAVVDSASTDEKTAITVANVLENDTDPDASDILFVASIDVAGTAGKVTDNGDGTFGYDPGGALEYLAAGETVTDSFDYVVSDGKGGSATATVEVTVIGVNAPPAASSDRASTDENKAITIGNVLSNDVDPDASDSLVVTFVDRSGTAGILIDNGDGTFGYDPGGAFEKLAVGETAVDRFGYFVADGNGGDDKAKVRIKISGVNDPPEARPDSASTDEKTAITLDNLLQNDTDPDASDSLVLSGLDTAGTAGKVIDNGDGTVLYDPAGAFESLAEGETAVDSFGYSVNDGNGGIDSAKVTLTVSGLKGQEEAPVPAGIVLASLEVASTPGLTLNDALALMDPSELAGNLSTVVRRALETHPDVAFQSARAAAARERVGTAYAGYLPTLDARIAGGYERSDNPATRARVGGDDELDRQEASLILRQNLFEGLGTEASVESARVGGQIEARGVEDVSEVLSLRVVRAYLDVLNFEGQVSLAEKNVESHKSLLELVRKRVEQQVDSRSEVSQVLARLRAAEASHFRFQGDLADARAAYEALLEEMPGRLVKPKIPRREVPEKREEGIAVALQYRAVMNQARNRVGRARAEVKKQKAAFFPKVDVDLSANHDRDIDGTPGKNESFDALLVVTYNLYAGGADKHRKKEAEYQLSQATSDLDRVRRDVTEEVTMAYNALEIARFRLKAFEDQVAENEQVRQAYFQQYRVGKRTLLDLLDSERELFLSRSNRTTEEYQEGFAVYRVLQSQGRLLAGLGVDLPAAAIFEEVSLREFL